MLSFIKSFSFTCFNDPDLEDHDPKDPDPKDSDPKNSDPKEPTFNQEQVNTFLAAEKRKTQTAQKELADQLAEYKKIAKLSEEEKTALAAQIDDLQTKYMTVEERQRQEDEKKANAHQLEVETLNTELDSWKTRFTSSTIEVALVQAANTNKAIQAEQIAAILRPSAKLVEKVDEEGHSIGTFEPRVDFADTDKAGKPIILDLTVSEAVKRMAELPQYGNLFEGNKTGGLGSTGGKSRGKVDLAKIAREDPALYRKMRKEQPELFANY